MKKIVAAHIAASIVPCFILYLVMESIGLFDPGFISLPRFETIAVIVITALLIQFSIVVPVFYRLRKKKKLKIKTIIFSWLILSFSFGLIYGLLMATEGFPPSAERIPSLIYAGVFMCCVALIFFAVDFFTYIICIKKIMKLDLN